MTIVFPRVLFLCLSNAWWRALLPVWRHVSPFHSHRLSYSSMDCSLFLWRHTDQGPGVTSVETSQLTQPGTFAVPSHDWNVLTSLILPLIAPSGPLPKLPPTTYVGPLFLFPVQIKLQLSLLLLKPLCNLLSFPLVTPVSDTDTPCPPELPLIYPVTYYHKVQRAVFSEYSQQTGWYPLFRALRLSAFEVVFLLPRLFVMYGLRPGFPPTGNLHWFNLSGHPQEWRPIVILLTVILYPWFLPLWKSLNLFPIVSPWNISNLFSLCSQVWRL